MRNEPHQVQLVGGVSTEDAEAAEDPKEYRTLSPQVADKQLACFVVIAYVIFLMTNIFNSTFLCYTPNPSPIIVRIFKYTLIYV